jgi:hypothetical protein
MFTLSNPSLPTEPSGSERQRAALEKARSWLDASTSSFADGAARQTAEAGQMATSSLDNSMRRIQQGMEGMARRKAEEEANKGGLGDILKQVLPPVATLVGGPGAGALAAGASRFL